MRSFQTSLRAHLKCSTVSRICRSKKQCLLITEDDSDFFVKQSKDKISDVGRTLAIGIKKREEEGLSLHDDTIREQAQTFALDVKSSEYINEDWLEEFKQKNSELRCEKVFDRSNSQTSNDISIFSDQIMSNSSNLKSKDQEVYSDFSSIYPITFPEHAMTYCSSPEIDFSSSFSPYSFCGSFVPEIADSFTPSYFSQFIMATPTLIEEMSQSSLSGIDATGPALHPQSQQNTSILSPSACLMAPPPRPPPIKNPSPTARPSFEETRRAMDTVTDFFQHHQKLNQDESERLGKLKVKLVRLERGDGTRL